jgi:plastocyanin
MRHPLWAAAVLLLASVVAVLAKEVTVKLGYGGLAPARVTIGKGDTVVFQNTQDMPGGYTVVADDGSFRSPALAKDKTWSHTFEEAGTYAVHLREHPAAGGEIVVK